MADATLVTLGASFITAVSGYALAHLQGRHSQRAIDAETRRQAMQFDEDERRRRQDIYSDLTRRLGNLEFAAAGGMHLEFHEIKALLNEIDDLFADLRVRPSKPVRYAATKMQEVTQQAAILWRQEMDNDEHPLDRLRRVHGELAEPWKEARHRLEKEMAEDVQPRDPNRASGVTES